MQFLKEPRLTLEVGFYGERAEDFVKNSLASACRKSRPSTLTMISEIILLMTIPL